MLCAGAGILVLRFGRDTLSEGVFWIGLAVVLVVAIGGIFATAFIWRCPSCNRSLWSLPNPDRCPGCKSAFR